MKHQTLKLLHFFLLLLSARLYAQIPQTIPIAKWTYDNMAPSCITNSSWGYPAVAATGAPTNVNCGTHGMGYAFVPNFGNITPYIAQNGQVGAYFTSTASSTYSFYTSKQVSNFGSSNISVEFGMRLDYDLINHQILVIQMGSASTSPFLGLKILPQQDQIQISGRTISMASVGPEDLGYIFDGQWHHYIIQRYESNGQIFSKLWIDGYSPSSFTVNITGTSMGNINCATASNPNLLFTRATGNLGNISVDVDEIAYYNTLLPNDEIYAHSNNFRNGLSYDNTQNWNISPPVSYNYGNDPAEALPTNGYSFSPQTYESAINQLKHFRVPRYKPNHNLEPNFSYWTNMRSNSCPSTTSGGTPATCNSSGNFLATSDFVIKMKELQLERAKFFNYNINLGNLTTLNRTSIPAPNYNYRSYEYVQLANQHPEYPVEGSIFWLALSNRHSFNNVYDPASYTTSTTSCPTEYLKPYYINNQLYAIEDGVSMRGNNNTRIQMVVNDLTRPLDYIQENGEIGPIYNMWPTSLGNNTAGSIARLTCLNDGNANIPLNGANISGTNQYVGSPIVDDYVATMSTALQTSVNWSDYLGQKSMVLHSAYRDQLLQPYTNSNGTQIIGNNTKFSLYDLNASSFTPDYAYTRNINTPINGKSYGTDYFYGYSGPKRWRTSNGHIRGMNFIMPSRTKQISFRDYYFSPYVAPGWDAAEFDNLRPGQWLGLTKILSALGAENFHTANFAGDDGGVVVTDYYIWETVIPAYAQAITSRYEDIFRNGRLIKSNSTRNFGATNLTDMNYLWQPQSPHNAVVVKQAATPGVILPDWNSNDFIDKYVITGSIQPTDNRTVLSNGTIQYLENNVTLGNIGTQAISFPIRRQGSTYIYDITGNEPVFYQLDKWHQYEHPMYWDKNFVFEGEVYDITTNPLIIRTEDEVNGSPFTPITNGDFTHFTSYIRVDDINGQGANSLVQYKFVPRENTEYNLRVRLRRNDVPVNGPLSGVTFSTSPDPSSPNSNGWIGATYSTTNNNWHEYDFSFVPNNCEGTFLANEEYSLNLELPPFYDIDWIKLHDCKANPLRTKPVSFINTMTCIPNPFETELTINFDLTNDDVVTIQMLDYTGRVVKVIADKKEHFMGKNQLQVDLSDLASGVYICELKTSTTSMSQKVIKTGH